MVATLGPSWFLQTEIVFDIVFMIATAVVMYNGYRAYRFFGDERHKLHSKGFLFLSASYLILAATNLLIMLELREVEYVMRKLVEIAHLTLLGQLLHTVLFLIGLTYLLIVYLQVQERSVRVLLFVLTLSGVLLSHQVRSAFYLLVAVLLLFIIYKLGRNYLKKRKTTALLVLLSFICLFLGEVLLSIIFINQEIYVAAGVATLVAYLLMIANQFLVMR